MHALMLVAAVALAGAGPAPAQAANAKAPCPAVHGKPAKASACGKAKTPPIITKCRDVITHRFAKCGGPNAEPVPAN